MMAKLARHCGSGLAVLGCLAVAASAGCPATVGLTTDAPVPAVSAPAALRPAVSPARADQAERDRSSVASGARAAAEAEPLVMPTLAADRPPATEAAERVMSVLQRVEHSLAETRFQAQTIVNERRGVYYWDCSGMAAWVLRRSAPWALAAIGRRRPVAADFYEIIARSPAAEAKRGWLRLSHPTELRPGDVFAWLRPPHWKRANTGHVGFVVSTAKPHPRFDDVWLMRIADATRALHGDDTRADDGKGGFGTGTIAFRIDETGQPWAYGWYGARQRPERFVPTRIAFGRVVR